jgi:hypothetical protein
MPTIFVVFVVDQLQTETSQFGDFKYHDSGVGTTAENVTNTDMETTDGESRATGTTLMDRLVKSSTGVYYVDVDANAEGPWPVRFYSTGTGQAAEEDIFYVEDSRFS